MKHEWEQAVNAHEEETATAAEGVTPERQRRAYTVSPLVAATRRLTKAQKAFDKARAALERQVDVQAEYEAAAAEYEEAAAEMRNLVAE